MFTKKKEGPGRPFTHAEDCKILKADPTTDILWSEIERGFWVAECVCSNSPSPSESPRPEPANPPIDSEHDHDPVPEPDSVKGNRTPSLDTYRRISELCGWPQTFVGLGGATT